MVGHLPRAHVGVTPLGWILILVGCASTPPEETVRPSAEPVTAEGDPRTVTEGDPPTERFRESTEILQLVLDAKELEPYWHIAEHPERAPLEIEVMSDLATFASSHGATDAKLTKFGQPVVVKNAPPGPGDRPSELRFGMRLDVRGDTAEVELRYPVEGLGGVAKLAKEAGRWQLVEVKVVEH